MKQTPLNAVEDADPIRTQAAAWFARLHDDEVSEAEQAEHQAWLDADPAHRQAHERIERTWRMLSDFSATPEISQRLAAIPAAATPQALPQPRRRPGRMRWLAACAAAVTAVVIGWRLLAPAPATELRYASAVGEHRSITLEDGTQLELDTGTQVRVRYSTQQRRISLDQGRAFFKVARDTARPLTVDTAQGSVRAVGTEFEVYRRADALDVTLFEGKVQLRAAAADDSTAALATLIPGQRAHLAAGQRLQVQTFQGGSAPAWLQGQLVFNDLPLRLAVEEFNRYGGTPLRVDDAALGELRISGVFRSNDSAGFVEALAALHGISPRKNAAGETELRR